MQTEVVYHPAATREFKDFGFMQAHLLFKPHLEAGRRRFGALITIDDGTLAPGVQGFGLHPHRDVEVVTFMVSGEVSHVDPAVPVHNGTVKAKGLQVITAGTGILHNEVNNSRTKPMRGAANLVRAAGQRPGAGLFQQCAGNRRPHKPVPAGAVARRCRRLSCCAAGGAP